MPDREPSSREPIAIVGIGGIFPGARDPEEFWKLVLDGASQSREVPRGRWPMAPEDVYSGEPGEPDRVYSTRGCFIDEIPRKSSIGMGIGPELLAGLDPAFHLLLHAGQQAWRDARWDNITPERVGVVIGNLALPTDSATSLAWEYLGRTLEEKVLGQSQVSPAKTTHPMNRHVTGLPAGILAKALGLGGGSMALDAACASSLYALKIAANELAAGRIDAALAGGLSRPDCLYTQMGFSQLRALSPTGACAPFDARGDGLVVGEGSGIVVLKRLSDAQRDNDRIYAVIRGIGLSNDTGGRLLAPESSGQLRAMRGAYEQAGWAPDTLDLIECHATGTPVGDRVEFESLRSLWGAGTWDAGQCVIGSVKSNVGHLLTAAGSAALIKTLLALKHKTLPPTANFERPASDLGMAESPFQVLAKPKPWHARETGLPRRAGVSAFGFGGINAHVLLEEYQEPAAKTAVAVTAAPPAESVPIAVVGMGAHVGPWDTLRKFQERVFGGRNSDTPTRPRHWWGAELSAWFKLQGLAGFSFRGHYIRQLEIEKDRYRIPPKELEELLPQQLLMLKVADEALESAGWPRDKNSKHNTTGVYIGTALDLNTTNYSLRWTLPDHANEWARHLGIPLNDHERAAWIDSLREAAGPALTPNRTMGGLGSIAASRIAREFRFGGPAFAVTSEENSGMRALETAVRALQSNEIDSALVGAVDLAGDLRSVLTTHRGRAYGPSATARPFDNQADGTVPGEGATAVVLKRLEDAQRDGDRVFSVIRGIGTASAGGVESQIPDAAAYKLAVQRALTDAQVRQESITYLETHGSGNADEDQMELQALTRAFKSPGTRPDVMLGSTKADIGHTGAAAGLASFVKTSLCLYHQVVPPLRNHASARGELAEPGHRLAVPRHAQVWLHDHADDPRRAGVSAFSIDGSCTHVVLEACDTAAKNTRTTELLQPLGAREEALFSIEAHNPPALAVALDRLQSRVQRSSDANIEALARAWWRENHSDPNKPIALSIVARNGAELLDMIAFARRSLNDHPNRRLGNVTVEGQPPTARDRVFYSPEPLGPEGEVAFVFPGSGNHYLGMGRDLWLQWPEIMRQQNHENLRLRSQLVPELFWNSESLEEIHRNHKAALFGQVALGTAVSDLVQRFGVRPNAVIGYSLGETAGLFALRAWTDRDLMLDRIDKSTLFTEDLAGSYNAARRAWNVPGNKTVEWALGVIDRPAKVVRAALKDHKKVYSLIVNTVHECVVGGDAHAVAKLVKKLDCEFFPLHGVTTVHCEVAKEVQQPYRELHLLDTTPPKDIRFYSGAWGTAYNLSRESAADSVLAQAIYGIDYPKVIEAAYEDGARVFIEMGPGASCSRMIGEILTGRPHLARSTAFQGQDAASIVLRLLGQLTAERVVMDLSVLYGQDTTVLEHQVAPAETAETLTIRPGGRPFEPVLPPHSREAVEEAPVETEPEVAPTPEPSIPAPAFIESIEPLETNAAWLAADIETPVEFAAVEARADAHAAWLSFAQSTTSAVSEALAFQLQLLEQAQSGQSTTIALAPPPAPVTPPAKPDTSVVFDRAQCMKLAIGSLAEVLGPEFAEVDTYPTRVRLPDEPLMLVDRIVGLEGEPKSLGSGRVITEHDVNPGDWYLDTGRIPPGIAIESGQADLFLSGYLGIDFITKGQATYRLLDAAVTFHRGLPQPGAVIRYDIRIERFFRQGDTWLFRFNFDATVNGEPLLTMRDGCAGFFTQAELDAGRGIVEPNLRLDTGNDQAAAPVPPLVPLARGAYDDTQVDALRQGNFAAAFGAEFQNLNLASPVGMPGGRLAMLDRVLDFDPNGGRHDLGLIRTEMDIYPDDWFLTCHFSDDQVMPGTLMYECCLHTLRIFMMRRGWVGESGKVVYEPMTGVNNRLKCRGQVVETTEKVRYELTIKELGYNPAPYAIADALMYADGRAVVAVTDIGLQLTGTTQSELEQLWSAAPSSSVPAQSLVMDQAGILAFAIGNPSEAFGEAYKCFDNDRFIARLPGPPYMFMDRVTHADHALLDLAAGGSIVAEYDVPPNEWYFDAGRSDTMPFAVLLEIALQPCGWFAAYMGSAFASDAPLQFRNLGGEARQHREVTRNTGTLTTRIECTRISKSGGMLIQHFNLDVRANNQPVYEGTTYFGYFSPDALADQVGIRDAKIYTPTDREISVTPPAPYPRTAPFPDEQMRMIDTIDIFDPAGGPEGLGFIRGGIDVNPDAWFFKAHFYKDPVWPGSLGIESFLQLLTHTAVQRWNTGTLTTAIPNHTHRWTYRGQILPTDNHVTVDAWITKVDDEKKQLTANGFLTVDNRIIYQMNDFILQLTPK